VLGTASDVNVDTLISILRTQTTYRRLSRTSSRGSDPVPAPNYLGSDSFTYQANDGALNSGVATVSILITGVNDAPVAVDDSYTKIGRAPRRERVAAGVVATDSEVYGDRVSAVWRTQPT